MMTKDFNRHDAKAATQMYAPDARFVTVRGDLMEGQPAIEKGMASIFGTRAKNASLRTLNVAIKFIRPDIALVHVTNELSGLVAPDGQTLPSHQELSLRVFAKESGIWRVAALPQHHGQVLQRTVKRNPAWAFEEDGRATKRPHQYGGIFLGWLANAASHPAAPGPFSTLFHLLNRSVSRAPAPKSSPAARSRKSRRGAQT